eukprot:1192403-Prorocentrum_minimum.AAC.2
MSTTVHGKRALLRVVSLVNGLGRTLHPPRRRCAASRAPPRRAFCFAGCAAQRPQSGSGPRPSRTRAAPPAYSQYSQYSAVQYSTVQCSQCEAEAAHARCEHVQLREGVTESEATARQTKKRQATQEPPTQNSKRPTPCRKVVTATGDGTGEGELPGQGPPTADTVEGIALPHVKLAGIKMKRPKGKGGLLRAARDIPMNRLDSTFDRAEPKALEKPFKIAKDPTLRYKCQRIPTIRSQ